MEKMNASEKERIQKATEDLPPDQKPNLAEIGAFFGVEFVRPKPSTPPPGTTFLTGKQTIIYEGNFSSDWIQRSLCGERNGANLGAGPVRVRSSAHSAGEPAAVPTATAARDATATATADARTVNGCGLTGTAATATKWDYSTGCGRVTQVPADVVAALLSATADHLVGTSVNAGVC